MDIFLAGTAVSLNVPLLDRGGNQLTISSVDYRVVDQTGAEVVPRANLATFVSGSPQAVVDVAAPVNQIATVSPDQITQNQIDLFTGREVRTVELFLTDANGNVIVMAKSYALEFADPLIVGVNSFQSYAQAELTSLDIPGIDGWNGSQENDKVAALIEARTRICQLNFWLLNSNVNWGQDNLSFVPEGSYQSPYASQAGSNSLFIFNGNLSLLTPAQFNKLPVRFLAALRKGQVAEADSILGGNPVDIRRQEGLLLESIGEVKQMFRSGKPLDLPVSKRALRYMSQFVTFAKRVGRG